jgi:hypothetical protein
MPTGSQWPASTQDGDIVQLTISARPDGTFEVSRPVVHPTWVDRNDGWVIRPVLADLADPSVSAATKVALQASLDRTRMVVGDFLAPG